MYFLERIARLLYEQSGKDLKKQCLVFPNRRAGIYFLKYLAAQIDKPVWTPAVLTIKEFFTSFSNLHIPENEILLCELYKVYRDLNKSAEAFDEFYFWGEMLAGDFDDADKYMADTAILFRNVVDFKNIDAQFEDIDPDQAEIIKQFWRNFNPEKTSKEKSEFKMIWSLLGDLYDNFRISLRSRNLAYEGMIFRDVAVKASSDDKFEMNWEKVHFIGFNALNKCEEEVMKRLQRDGRARFYWDFDNSYVRGGKLNSAGLFMERNLRTFGNDMPGDWNYDTLLSSNERGASVQIIETTSDIGQVKLIPYLFSHLNGVSSENANHTAVILADEGLLVPVLTSLPGDIGNINISMGYPLKMTGVYAMVKYMLNLQRNARNEGGADFLDYRDVIDISKHQLIEQLLTSEDKSILAGVAGKKPSLIPAVYLAGSKNLSTIFRIDESPVELSEHLKDILLRVTSELRAEESGTDSARIGRDLRNEFIYRILLSINRLEAIVRTSGITFKKETYIRILDSILRGQSVPFTGEPLSGVQIMGILETRALDFENIILLSVNEGVLPAITSPSSFIPFSIREAFGLPTINHQESVFAYHFYRLLHRAKKVTLVYNSDSEGIRTGEMSRFILQMKYERIIKPDILNLDYNIKSPAGIGNIVVRTESHSERLFQIYEFNGGRSALSPTAINTWLYCRMMFFYRYVNGLKEPETMPGEIDHSMFGQIVHRIMRNVYMDFLGREVTKELIIPLLENEVHQEALIERSLSDESDFGDFRLIGGNELILRDILKLYLKRILKADVSITPFRIISLEKSYVFRMTFETDGKKRSVIIGGNVDRVDQRGRVTRIVDYKTGIAARKINSIEDLFIDDRKRELDGWLQTLLYCEAFLQGNPDANLRPSIYRVREITERNLSDGLKIRVDKNQELLVEDFNYVREEFLDGLRRTIEQIFDPTENFIMTETTSKCGNCPYRLLCQR